MTWVWIFLAWMAVTVLLGMLIGILLGIRRTLDDVHAEAETTRVMVEEMRNRPMPLPETEHAGTVAMETTPKTTIVREKPDEHKWKRGRIGEDD